MNFLRSSVRTLGIALTISLMALLSACGLPANSSGGLDLTANQANDADPGKNVAEQEAAVLRAPRDAAALKGMAAMEVTAALGKPTQLRRDKPAEIWQYVTTACVLDVFLYEEGGVQRVAHAQVRYPRGRSRDPDAQTQCLSELFRKQLQSRRTDPTLSGQDAS